MNDASLLPVVIVGGGFSGAMLAARLAERGQASILIERGDAFGPGVAYSTTNDAHRLNVRAGRMGAVADRPDDFIDWLAAHHPYQADPDGFAHVYAIDAESGARRQITSGDWRARTVATACPARSAACSAAICRKPCMTVV